MRNLATRPDLVSRLGRDFTAEEDARVDALLADASSLVRSYTLQDFTSATSTVTLRAQGGLIRLPKRPVTAVSSVTAIGLNGTPDVALADWWWDGLNVVRIGDGMCVINMPETWHDQEDGYPGTYRVVYAHGDDDVPGDVVAVTSAMVLRCVTAPTQLGGVTSETIGPYSYRLESANMGTAVTMTDADRDALKHYRPRAGTASMRTY